MRITSRVQYIQEHLRLPVAALDFFISFCRASVKSAAVECSVIIARVEAVNEVRRRGAGAAITHLSRFHHLLPKREVT